MNIKKRLLPLALVMLLSPITAFAESAVPHTINLQSMVFDAEGKVTASESVDMTIRILDADNNVLFSEAQNGVVVVKGAINVNIGEASGGIPLDILDPSTGIKLIDIEIAGQSPFELMPLGALPYAMWAEKSLTVANDSIGSEQIKNGSIKAEDIDPLAFADIKGTLGDAQLPASAATVGQLNAHVNSTTAHPASAIVVSGNFVTFVATNVQEALQKLDAKLVDEIVNRKNMMIDSAHIVDGTIVNADIGAGAAIATSKLSGPVTSIAGNGLGSLATLSAVSGGTGGTITDGTITGADIQAGSIPTSKLSDNSGNPLPDFAGWDQNASDDFTKAQADPLYVDVGGDTMTSDLIFNAGSGETARIQASTGNITTAGTVDGVDVGTAVPAAQSTANTAVTDAATAQITATNAATAAATAQSTADGKVSKSGDTITGTLTINNSPGVPEFIFKDNGGVETMYFYGGRSPSGLAGSIAAEDGGIFRRIVPFAYGSVGPSSSGCTVTNAYNVVSGSTTGNSNECQINFRKAATVTDYTVVVTRNDGDGTNDNTAVAWARTEASFRVLAGYSWANGSFIVFSHEPF